MADAAVRIDNDDDALTDDERALYEASRGDDGAAEQPAPAEAPEPAAAEDAEAADAEPKRGERDDGKVPSWRLREQTEKLAKAEERAAKTERQLAEIVAKINAAQERADREAAEAAAKAPPPPDPDTQPFEALKYERERRQALEERISGAETRQAEERQAADTRTRFETELGAHEAAYQKDNPDYYDRVQHVVGAYTAQLMQQAPGLPEQQAKVQAINYMKAQAYDMVQRQMDPAVYFHGIAPRMGYKGKATAAAPPAAKPNGREAFRSLSDASGAAPRGELTLEKMAAMSEDDMVALSRKKGVDLAKLIRPRD